MLSCMFLCFVVLLTGRRGKPELFSPHLLYYTAVHCILLLYCTYIAVKSLNKVILEVDIKQD